MRAALTLLIAVLALISIRAGAEPANSNAGGPILAELFTSQGCSSCPPAEAYFEDLTERDDVVVIVWHVDVWDRLVHRGSSWKDPYSDPAFTTRLRWYNKVLRGTPQIFTPQAIIGGQTSVIGSRTSEIETAIKTAKRGLTEVSFLGRDVAIRGAGKGDVIFVRLLREHQTDVTGGENKGRVLSGKNIALEGRILAKWTGDAITLELPDLAEGETCAVFVQAPRSGPILGAGMCD